MRPIYESPADLQNEKDVVEKLTQSWGIIFHKLPMSYHIDWLMVKDGNPRGFAELKCRRNDRQKYPTFMISLAKWMRGKELAHELSIPFIIIVRWNDGIFFHKAGTSPVTFGFGGRSDRGDSQDVEPVVYIGTEHFQKIV